MKRAAVVIGVNKAGNLPALAAAQKSANEFADWLEREGFAPVKRFTDESGEVAIKPIEDFIKAQVKRSNLDQLLVYFSGHGFLVGDAEMWMLSGAPESANEAVNLTASVLRARESGIPYVIFISDACRSVPEGFQAALVNGSSIFPNPAKAASQSSIVDRFFATQPAQTALELKLDEAVKVFEAAYTKTFLSSFAAAPPQIIKSLTVEGQTIEVIPNRPLKQYLRARVPKVVAAKFPQITQRPDAYIESEDAAYIGRVTGKIADVAAAGGGAESASWALDLPLEALTSKVRKQDTFDLAEIVGAEFASAVVQPHTIGLEITEGLGAGREARAFARDYKSVRDSQKRRVAQFESQTGFDIFGTRLSDAVAVGARAEVLKGEDVWRAGHPPSGRDHVRVWPDGRNGASVVIRFADGSGTVLAAIPGFIATVIVDTGKVTDVAYAPAANSEYWGKYRFGSTDNRERVERLHAMAAAAARNGAFHLVPKSARRLAETIRGGKGADPTLGLHAAYAYSDAGKPSDARSVHEIMRHDTKVSLFDVALMAGALANVAPSKLATNHIYPFCPMLTRGWSLLKIMRAKVARPVLEAAAHLEPALWTTFGPKGMEILISHFKEKPK